MILKGSQRANGTDLAIHLMNGFDNEHVEIAEVYGAVADDLLGAFAEFEAVAAGTRAEQYLYSLSINPSAPLTREQYNEAIQDIEHRLGLTEQPRAVVFHIKDDREHCHVVWSRIDVDNMKAIQMSHDRRKLMDLACELAQKYGLDLPPGLQAWAEKQKFEKEKLEPSLAEKAQADQTNITPDQRRAEITEAYECSDNAEAFRAALEEKGYVLAAGDRRGFVVVDRFGNPHSLSRYVKGHNAKDIRAKLAPLTPEDLPTVEQAKETQRQRSQAQKESQGEGDRQREQAEARRREAEQSLAKKHADRRLEIRQQEQGLLTRQQDEKLSLHAAQARAAKGLVYRVRSAVVDFIRRTPGVRSVLHHLQKLTHLDPKERHALERDALDRRHARERLDIERQKRFLAKVELREKQSLERKLKQAARQGLKAEVAPDALEREALKSRQDFFDAARDRGTWRKRQFKHGEMSVEFNDAAEFVEGADRTGDEDDDHAPDWKQRAEDNARKRKPEHRPNRGKAYGKRRGDD